MKNQKEKVDLSNLAFNYEKGVFELNLRNKSTQKKLWQSMQQFKDIKTNKK